MKIKNKNTYFLPKNTGLIFNKILHYRVIFQYKNKEKNLLPEIFDFNNLDLAINFCKNIKNFEFVNLTAIVEQNGFYLEDIKGNLIENKSKIRYRYINEKRFAEFGLNFLKKKYDISIY